MAAAIDNALKITVISSAILAAASVAYYFVVYLPQRDAQMDAERRAEVARAAANQQTAQEKAHAERLQALAIEQAREGFRRQQKEAAHARYRQCVHNAEIHYANSWAENCKRLALEQSQNHARCMKMSYMSKDSCDHMYKTRDATSNCTLPRTLGTDLNSSFEQARGICLQEHQAGLN